MLYGPTIGIYKDRHYQIRFNALKHPCGHVRIEDEDIEPLRSLKEFDWDVVNDYINMHGGCTFVRHLSDDKGMWIGFDTTHSFDNKAIRTIDFVRNECMYMIDQLLDLQKEK